MIRPANYRPDIDGLRALAVLSIMLYHLNDAVLPGGFVGVDVFFAISGFVVTSSLVGNGSKSLRAFFGEFYVRRLARILPALVFVLVVSAFAATLFIAPSWLSELSETTARHAFFGLSNWVMQRNSDTYFAPRADFNPYTHTWSLGLEEQFYLLAPLLVYFWIRAVRRSRVTESRIAFAGLASLTAVSLAVCIWSSRTDPTAAFYFIGSRLWELAAGALLFLATCQRKPRVTAPRVQTAMAEVTGWAGLLCIAISFVYADSGQFPWPWALLPVLGALLVTGGAHVRPTGMARRALASMPAAWIGKRSYSLYLWHWPVYVLMRWTVGLHTLPLFSIALVATFALAMFSYRWIEQPLRHNVWIERQPVWLRVSGFLLLPFLGFYAVTHFFDHRTRYSLSRVARSPGDWYAGARMAYPDIGDRQCTVDVEFHGLEGGSERRYVPKDCRVQRPARNIHVLGDSHALAVAPILEQLSAELGMTVHIYSIAACDYIDFQTPMNTNRSPECLAFNRAITKQILDTSGPDDVVFLPTLRLLRYGDQWASYNVSNMYERMYGAEVAPARQAAFEDAKQMLAPFAEKRLEVIFDAPLPVFKAPAFRCSDWFNRMNPICVGQNQQPRAELETLRKPIVDSMTALSREFPNVQVWDPFPLLCPGETCRTEREGRPLFFDGDHLSAYGNLVLYPSFKQIIQGELAR